MSLPSSDVTLVAQDHRGCIAGVCRKGKQWERVSCGEDREGVTVTEWGVVIDDLGSTDMADSEAQARAWLANGEGQSLVRVVVTEWPATPDGGDRS